MLFRSLGSYGGMGIEAGLSNVVRSLDRGIALADAPEMMVLIENTAGQGAQLGARFEELSFIFREARSLTSYKKVCSESLEELKSWAADHGQNEPRFCRTCSPRT